MEITKKQFVTGAFWKILEQLFSKGASLVISIVLARLLDADAFGLIALTAVFTNLSDILVDGGFSTALISKKDVDDIDYSNTLFVSLSISSLLYIVLFFSAPAIASYYEESALVSILRVVGITFFVQAFASTRTAIVNRQMRFKFLFYCNLISTVVSGFIGIICAYQGLGVWAIVVQRLLQQILTTALLFILVRFKLIFRFDFSRFKDLLKMSIGIVSASMVNYLASSLYSLVIGKIYSVADLGYFDKGPQIPMQVSLYLFGAITSVLLPTLVSYKMNKERIKSTVRRITHLTAYLITPIMVGMALTSSEIILILFTDKWMPMLKIMQYSCIYYLATPFMLINVQVFLAFEKTNYRVLLEILRFFLMISALFIFSILLKWDINGLQLASSFVAIVNAFSAYLVTRKLIGYSLGEFVKDCFKPTIISIIMSISVILADALLNTFSMGVFVALIVKITVGVFTYILFSIIFKVEGFYEIFNTLRAQIGKNE